MRTCFPIPFFLEGKKEEKFAHECTNFFFLKTSTLEKVKLINTIHDTKLVKNYYVTYEIKKDIKSPFQKRKDIKSPVL